MGKPSTSDVVLPASEYIGCVEGTGSAFSMDIQHQDSKRGGVFFMEENGRRLAEITYQWHDASTIVADHTWVDNSLRGQGIARKMLDVLVDFARQKQLKIVPQCSYVDVMFKRDSSLADVAATAI